MTFITYQDKQRENVGPLLKLPNVQENLDECMDTKSCYERNLIIIIEVCPILLVLGMRSGKDIHLCQPCDALMTWVYPALNMPQSHCTAARKCNRDRQ